MSTGEMKTPVYLENNTLVDANGTPLADRGVQGLGGESGPLDLTDVTTAASAATEGDKLAFLEAVGAAAYRPPVTANVDFSLNSAYANRRTDCTKDAAQAVLWESTHALADGDSGRLMQVGAGPITITKDAGFVAGELKLATGVDSATTVNDGDVLDWEYEATGQRLLITYRSAAGVAGASKVTPYSDGTGVVSVAPGNTSEFTLSSITIPANKIGPNGWVELFYSTERTVGAGTLTTRIRVANATTGAIIAAPSAGTRMVAMAALVSQNSTTSHRSWAPVNTGDHVGTTTTVTDTTDTTGAVTFYLTGQLATGTDTATKYYFKAVVYNPDA